MIEISLSVHEIVDLLLRKGDIDDRYFNSTTMEQGTILHKEYQAKQGEMYLSEVPLKVDIEYDIFLYHISGRADGIIIKDNEIVIDEIKTTNKKIEEFYLENKDWHLGQAEFYGYMFAKEKNIHLIVIQLTYISQVSEDKEIKTFTYTYEELERKIYNYIKDYSSFKLIIHRKDNITQSSLNQLKFPFANLREGQDQLIRASIEAAENNSIYFIQASTGIGKTISTLYGSLCALKDKKINRIFYLTPKNSGFEQSKKGLKYFEDCGVKVTSVEILAKSKICINEKRIGRCNPDYCPYTIGYYQKLTDILKELLLNPHNFSSSEIKDVAIKNRVCPFELSLDVSSYSDVIICDYNYAFNPISMLQRYFSKPEKEYSKFLLVDEAHNLVDRSRDMYSQTFSFKLFEEAKLHLDSLDNDAITKAVTEIQSYEKEFEKFEFSGYLVLQDVDLDFINSLDNLLKVVRNYRNEHSFFSDKYDYFSLETYKFIYIYNVFKKDESYFKIYLSKDEANKINISIKCLDSSYFIKQVVYKCDGSVFFSGTFEPVEYYENLILNRTDINNLSIPSPFDPNSLKVLVNKDISLLYKDREKTIREVAIEIKAFVSVKKGNYIVYCPSFEYLEHLKEIIEIPNANVIYQEKDMNNDEKLDFLKVFQAKSNNTNVGICVIGGSFSESIDLTGEQLIGVVIIGIGLPMVNFETNLEKEYYESQGYNGYEYAYFNVGMNRVMQAAGRVIRTETDRGALLLLDKRYANKKYQEILNSKWTNHTYVKNMVDIKRELSSFFNEI